MHAVPPKAFANPLTGPRHLCRRSPLRKPGYGFDANHKYDIFVIAMAVWKQTVAGSAVTNCQLGYAKALRRHRRNCSRLGRKSGSYRPAVARAFGRH